MSQTADKRVLFYVQHLLGIGHLTRASRIAHALSRRGFDVTVVTGGKPVEGFPGEGVRHVALPPVVSADEGFSKLADINGEPVDDAFKTMRRDRLLSILHDIRPQAILTEAFPFGRRQMRFELLPFLDAARALPERPMIFASIRDILQKRPKPERDVETLDYVEAYFDRVLVHGDPSFVRLEETFPFAERIADKVIYTGLVAPPAPPAPSETFDVVISAGGGAVGRQMLACAVEAAAQVEAKGRWLLITGPNLAEADFQALQQKAPAHLSVTRFRPDFSSLLQAAALSVSQAGYNTLCDILRAGCRSIVVPFTTGGETEQAARADRLDRLGLLTAIPEADLTPARLAEAMRQALAEPPPDRNLLALDLEGADNTATILASLI